MSIIKDKSLAHSGENKILWVRRFMPILNQLEREFSDSLPFKGLRITISVHLEAKTAYLALVLAAGGAKISITGCNPLSTQDDVAAALVERGIDVFAIHGVSIDEYTEHLVHALSIKPHIFIDDGGDLIHLLHTRLTDIAENIWGGSEETTTGVLRLHAREREGQLKIPMIAANDALCKYLFDNRYGTGQSVWDGIMRTTNLIIAGKTVIIAGYGWCGRGIAMRAKGLGATVIITEINPIKAMEAVMDGYSVMNMDQASLIGDIFITVTGCKDIITRKHFENMKSEVLLCNAGHFDVEINKNDLAFVANKVYESKNNIMTYETIDGRKFNLLAEGRLVNLAAGDGHPAEIMDMSFAIQALCVKYIAENYQNLNNHVYKVPEEIDQKVAMMKISSWGLKIDSLTEEQNNYLNAWGE